MISEGESLALNHQSCLVDLVEFERLSETDEIDGLRRCLQLYAGDLLEGMVVRETEFEEWLVPARARLRQAACAAVDKLTGLLIANDRVNDAIETLDRRLLLDPACEPAHAELMRLLVRAGRRSDALRQYQVCVDALRRDLDVEPGAEINSLYASIRKLASDDGGAQHHGDQENSARSVPDRPAVAVLPFDNLSGESDSYFVDGIVEDLITALSRFSALVVSARGSSFRYRDRSVPDRQIAEELGAQFLVRGSLQRVGKSVRINVRIFDSAGEKNLWAGRFDRELEDVFVVQDEITSTLVSILVGQVEAARLANARKAAPERLDAYDILLRGKDHHHRFTADDCRKSIELFERAVEKDPDYAVAYAWLACGLGQAMVFELDEKSKLIDRSEAAARRGLELDENESECHRLLAQISLTRGKLKRALWHQERALFLNPNDDRSVCSMGEILSYLGRHEEAEDWVRKSMKLNPYHPQRYWTHLARPLFHLGRFQEALDALENISRLRIDDLAYRVASTGQTGSVDECESAVSVLLREHPGFDAVAFVQSLPYENDCDRQALRDGLALAGVRAAG